MGLKFLLLGESRKGEMFTELCVVFFPPFLHFTQSSCRNMCFTWKDVTIIEMYCFFFCVFRSSKSFSASVSHHRRRIGFKFNGARKKRLFEKVEQQQQMREEEERKKNIARSFRVFSLSF